MSPPLPLSLFHSLLSLSLSLSLSFSLSLSLSVSLSLSFSLSPIYLSSFISLPLTFSLLAVAWLAPSLPLAVRLSSPSLSLFPYLSLWLHLPRSSHSHYLASLSIFFLSPLTIPFIYYY